MLSDTPPLSGAPAPIILQDARAEVARVTEVKKYYDESPGIASALASAAMQTTLAATQAALDEVDAAGVLVAAASLAVEAARQALEAARMASDTAQAALDKLDPYQLIYRILELRDFRIKS